MRPGARAREAVDLLGHRPSVAVWCAHDDPFPRKRRPVGHSRRVEAAGSVVEPRRARPAAEPGAVPLRRLSAGGGPSRACRRTCRPWRAPRASCGSATRAGGPPTWPRRWPGCRRWGQFVSAFGTPVRADQPEVVKTTVEILRRLKYRPTGGFPAPCPGRRGNWFRRRVRRAGRAAASQAGLAGAGGRLPAGDRDRRPAAGLGPGRRPPRTGGACRERHPDRRGRPAGARPGDGTRRCRGQRAALGGRRRRRRLRARGPHRSAHSRRHRNRGG